MPLWAGVLLTGGDIFLILAFFSSYPSEKANRSMHLFEGCVGLLVIIVLGALAQLAAS